MTRQMVAEGDEDVLCQRPDQHEAVIARWMAQLLRPKLTKATVGERGEVFAPVSVHRASPTDSRIQTSDFRLPTRRKACFACRRCRGVVE